MHPELLATRVIFSKDVANSPFFARRVVFTVALIDTRGSSRTARRLRLLGIPVAEHSTARTLLENSPLHPYSLVLADLAAIDGDAVDLITEFKKRYQRPAPFIVGLLRRETTSPTWNTPERDVAGAFDFFTPMPLNLNIVNSLLRYRDPVLREECNEIHRRTLMNGTWDIDPPSEANSR